MSLNIELARHNMIEQQVRPWDVLDSRVLEALTAVRREDFVPPACRNLAFADLNLPPGDSRFMATGAAGPFQNLQPFYYWGCQRDQSGTSQSPCTGFAPEDLQWTYNLMPDSSRPAPWCNTFSLWCITR